MVFVTRIAFSVSALLLVFLVSLAVLANDTPEPPGPAQRISIEYSIRNSKTQLQITTGRGKTYILSVARDATVSPKSKPSGVEIIGEIRGAAIILVDTYPSVPGGMSYCQAGEERFLRVLSIATKPPKETLGIKVESCRDNIELTPPGIEWLPESSTLRIHWLLAPNGKGMPEVRTIKLGPDGRPE